MSEILRHLLSEQQKANIKLGKELYAMDKVVKSIVDRYVPPEMARFAKAEIEEARNIDQYLKDYFPVQEE